MASSRSRSIGSASHATTSPARASNVSCVSEMNSASNSSIGPVRRRLQRTASRMLVKAALKRNWWHQAWALADAISFLRNAGSEQQDRIGGIGKHDLPTLTHAQLRYQQGNPTP